MGKVIHWELCNKFKIDHMKKWYMHNPESVLENESYKILSNGDINCNCYTWNNFQRIGKGIGRFGNKKSNGDHLDNSIIKTGQNTEKSLGEWRRLAITQTPVQNIS